MSIDVGMPPVVDERARAALGNADVPVAHAWRAVRDVADGDPPPMGLSAGDRPVADVEVLAGLMASAEYTVASRLHAASVAGCLPLPDRGGMLAARGWSVATSRRLARCGALAAAHPMLAGAWAAGVITAEHLDPVARAADRFTGAELAAVIEELGAMWGQLSPAGVARFVEAAARLLHPPDDPAPDEVDAHNGRDLSFAVTSDSVLLSASLPRVEGELVIAAIDAIAETLRSTAEHTPAGARRADALVQLVNTAHAADALPTRGGLPVALSVQVQHTAAGDPLWTTSRGHLLTESETRWAGCDAAVTPILTSTGTAHLGCDPDAVALPSSASSPPPFPPSPQVPEGSTATRIAALAATLFDTRIPLAVGRTARTATPAQRRALAARDRGCLIPGCQVPAEACQVHHLTEWSAGGRSDLPNLVLLCWSHHRQVDLRLWAIRPVPPGNALLPPQPGDPSSTAWPANNGAPFSITRTPRPTPRR